jgi:hypothetical protein
MLNDEIKNIYIKKNLKKYQSQPRLTLKLAILNPNHKIETHLIKDKS